MQFAKAAVAAQRAQERDFRSILAGALVVVTAIPVPATDCGAAEDGGDVSALDSARSPGEAILGGRLLLDLRPRYATVDQADKPRDAEAWTMRSLVGWQTRPWANLSATAQALNVGHLGPTHYATKSVTPSPYPVVRDPDNTDVNQLFLDFAGIADTRLRAGRQYVNLDNERMVGIKNFSRTPQVLDAALLTNHTIPATELSIGYVWRQRTTSATALGSNTWLLNGRVSVLPGGTVTGYVHLQDQADTNQVTGFKDNSNRIGGLRLDGAQPVGTAWRLLYTAEYARQRDYAGGDDRIDASYSRVGGGVGWKGLWLRVDQEVLGSDRGVYAFQTPLGSTHTFQGWADLFTTTPKNGLRDRFATLGAKVESLSILSELHWFHSDFSGVDYGRETDARLAWPLLKSLTGRFEVADYRAGDAGAGKADTRKIWLTLLYSY